MKSDDLFLNQILLELIKQHKCHTVILYGSRARGDFNDHSDYDILGIKKNGSQYRLAEKRNGNYLDIFVYPEKDLQIVSEEHFYMEGAKVLFEKDNFGTLFCNRLKKALRKKYKPLSNNEINVRKVWLHKMFERATKSDIEGNYRRSWLHEALLGEYFNIRKKRYSGSKKSFLWLKKNDPQTYKLFDQVLKSPNDIKMLKKLVENVSQLKIK